MVMNLNKKDFIKALAQELNYSIDESTIINDILESNFFLSRKNKDKIVASLMNELHVDLEEANKIYTTSVTIINKEIKEKLKHPFRNQINYFTLAKN